MLLQIEYVRAHGGAVVEVKGMYDEGIDLTVELQGDRAKVFLLELNTLFRRVMEERDYVARYANP